LNFDYEIKNNSQEKVILNNKYSFINEETLNKIVSNDFNINVNSICDYLINNKKLIIKYKGNCIIIGEIEWDRKSNLFNPELILEYYSESKMKEQFGIFRIFSNDIKKDLNLKGDENENIKEKRTDKTLGNAYFIHQSSLNNNQNYINVLLNIYLNYEYINLKINKKFENGQEFEFCYIVSKNYINQLKKIFNYEKINTNKIKEKFDYYIKQKNNFNELLNDKNFLEEIKNELMKNKEVLEFLNDKRKIKRFKEDSELTNINKIYLKDNEQLYYYKDFEIISNNLYQILDKENLSLNNENMIKIGCLFGENKILFNPTSSTKNFFILSKINSNNEFISEMILYYDNSSYLQNHKREIAKNKLENTINNLIFKDDKAEIFLGMKIKIGIAYKIKEENSNKKLSEKIKEEINTIIKIVLFNLDLQNKISDSREGAGSNNYGRYITYEKCCLINKEWMDKYKNYYLYNDIYKLIKNHLNEKLEKDPNTKKYFNE
jgi:hypothetical protein